MDRLLQGKLAAPRPRRLVRRTRLIELLDGILETRLTLLSAPPGFGKTSALVDWLSARGIDAGWLQLDGGDNDPASFARYLWAAGCRLPDAGWADRSASPGDLNALTAELAAVLDERPEATVLVLDDYHVIESPAIQEAVARLLERLPDRAHLVIATRADPALPLARLRASGELLEVRAEALRFTVEEATELFAARSGLALADPDVQALVERSEGWPAMLQLAGLSLAGRADAAAFVQAFAASHRHVLDFIREEVLAYLTPDEREFLLRTSVLDRLNGPLCDALTGRSDGQAMLEDLERRNVLLVPIDDERAWYRYHLLFAELLRSLLAARDRGAFPSLHARAADWYEAHGYTGDAIEHALRGGDGGRAGALVASVAGDLINTGRFATLRAWVDRLPADVVRSHLFLATMDAWALVLSGATGGLEERLATIETAISAATPGDPAALTMPAHVAMIRSVAARERGDLADAIAFAERALALALVPEGLPERRRALVVGDAQAILGHALLAAGDVDRAIDAYQSAAPLLEIGGNLLGVADITRNLARLEARRGRLKAALEACDEALAHAGAAADTPALAAVHLARAETLSRLAAPDARRAAERAIELARLGGDAVTAREARGLLERIAQRAVAEGSAAARPNELLVEPLSDRELEVLRLVAQGRSNREIAAELYLAVGTVKAHVHSISGKLGAANRLEAVACARAAGLV